MPIKRVGTANEFLFTDMIRYECKSFNDVTIAVGKKLKNGSERDWTYNHVKAEYKEKIILDDTETKSKTYQIDFKGFDFAFVSYTPISKKIHTISTGKKVESYIQEPNVIAGILEKKFGENLVDKGTKIKNAYYLGKHSTGQKGIILTCGYNFNLLSYYIQITVTDLDIVKEEEKELIEISTKEEIDKL